MDFSGKVAAVTGAARGLGKAYAEALLQRKAKVAVIDILEEAGQATVEEFQQKYGKGCAIFLFGDVGKQEVMEDVFKSIVSQLGPLDIMINNAGVGGLKLSAEFTIGINTLGLIRSTELAIKHMRKDEGGNGGTIINIGSQAGLYTSPGEGIYCASKFGAVSYTKCRADGMPEDYGIKLLCLNPTWIVTDMTAIFKQMQDDGNTKIKEWVDAKGGWIPMETVVDCAMTCLGDNVKNGSVVLVSGDGITYVNTEIKKTPFP